jgi:hypothetical protein
LGQKLNSTKNLESAQKEIDGGGDNLWINI